MKNSLRAYGRKEIKGFRSGTAGYARGPAVGQAVSRPVSVFLGPLRTLCYEAYAEAKGRLGPSCLKVANDTRSTAICTSGSKTRFYYNKSFFYAKNQSSKDKTKQNRYFRA